MRRVRVELYNLKDFYLDFFVCTSLNIKILGRVK